MDQEEDTITREKCSNCHFGRDGLCRRNPPTLLPELWRRHAFSPAKGSWPEVDAEDWCGEWKPMPAESP